MVIQLTLLYFLLFASNLAETVEGQSIIELKDKLTIYEENSDNADAPELTEITTVDLSSVTFFAKVSAHGIILNINM